MFLRSTDVAMEALVARFRCRTSVIVSADVICQMCPGLRQAERERERETARDSERGRDGDRDRGRERERARQKNNPQRLKSKTPIAQP